MSIHQLHPNGFPGDWNDQLRNASSEGEVVQLARYFLARLTCEEIASLPSGLRPRKLVDAQDVTSYGFELARFECKDAVGDTALTRLADFFTRAGIRLSKIMVEDRLRDELRSA